MTNGEIHIYDNSGNLIVSEYLIDNMLCVLLLSNICPAFMKIYISVNLSNGHSLQWYLNLF